MASCRFNDIFALINLIVTLETFYSIIIQEYMSLLVVHQDRNQTFMSPPLLSSLFFFLFDCSLFACFVSNNDFSCLTFHGQDGFFHVKQ